MGWLLMLGEAPTELQLTSSEAQKLRSNRDMGLQEEFTFEGKPETPWQLPWFHCHT